MLSDPSIYLLMNAIFNQSIDTLLLYLFQFFFDIHNRLIWNHVKQRSMVCGDISQENCHCSIQDSIVVVAHGGETWLK